MIFFYVLASMATFLHAPFLSRFLPDSIAFKALGAICFVYAVFYWRSGSTAPRFFESWQSRLLLLFYVIASASCAMGGNPSPWFIYTDFMLLFFVTVCVVDSLRRLSWVLFSALAGLAYGSVHVVVEWVHFHNIYSNYRAGLSVGDGNYFATSAVLCLPFALLAVLHGKKLRVRLLYGGCLVVSLLGVTVCASRGGFLALAAGLLYLVARSPHRARNLLLISAAVLPLGLFLPVSPLHRLLHPSRGDVKTSRYRLMAWKAGARMVSSHPLLGVGLGNFKPLMPQYADPGTPIDSMAHNTYIEVAAELGLPTLVVFLGIPFFSYRSLEKARRRARIVGREFPYYAASGLQAGLVGYMVGAFFLSAEYQKLFWLAIMLSMCLPRLVRVRRKRQGIVPDADVTSIPLFAESPQS
jgi:O-antigen ligase